ncbi:MAG: flavin oxidoreductase, Old Yellow Enzyme family [Acidobacteriales bacterium]|nr:flavin oxidoreductase, Old Yellow Enzyme family [Terriglobales bacterium]
MPKLFDPLRLRSLEFRNRIFVSPMCEYSSHDGFANEWHLVHLGSRAVGGAALVLSEASAVSPEGRITPADLGIWKDEHVESLATIFRFIHEQGSVAGMQLAHAGRKASTNEPWKGGVPISPAQGGWSPILAPSAIPFDDGYQTPKEMTAGDLKKVISDFVQAANRAHATGARVIEIHAAHGYLLHSFFSPLSNQRTDEYGGSFENRTRIIRDVLSAVRNVWPEELPVFVRISASDWVEGGWDIEQSVELAKQLKSLGADLIDCSSGGLVPNAKIPVGPGYQVPFAEQIRKSANIPTGAVGMITSSLQADQTIRTRQADAVFLARELLRDPYWPRRAAYELHQPEHWPPQYERARRSQR